MLFQTVRVRLRRLPSRRRCWLATVHTRREVGAVSGCRLADYGCAIAARLVLDGPFRGDVWVLDGSAGGYVPFGMMHELHAAHGERADPPLERYAFLDWYEDWLHQIVLAE